MSVSSSFCSGLTRFIASPEICFLEDRVLAEDSTHKAVCNMAVERNNFVLKIPLLPTC